MKLPLEADNGAIRFDLAPHIQEPASFCTAFVVLLDGDLVMSPEHLGVGLMTAVLRRAGFTVHIVEVETDDEAAAVEIERIRPDLVCFTLMTLNVQHCARLSPLVKQRLPSVTIACGGPAATFAPAAVLAELPLVDLLAIGEGEPTIFDLVSAFARAKALGEKADLDRVKGIARRGEDKSIKTTPLRPLMHNLDDLPSPVRDQFERAEGRFQYLRISTSRGCVARCSFCGAPHAGNRVQAGKAWRGRSAEKVIDEIDETVRVHGFRTFDFVDSTFEDPDGGRIGKARIRRIADGILERGVEIFYNCCMRAENWDESDKPLLELLWRSGLEKVNVGIESGVQEELDLWDKRACVADNIRIIRLLREQHIYLAMGFIQFHPYSTIETVRQNAVFLHEHAGHNLRRLTERLELYPGTPLVERLRADGLLDESFDRSLGHFAYRYRDEAIGYAARYFASLYNDNHFHENGVITAESAVYEMETFNVIIETYLSRILRRFGQIPFVVERLSEFRSELEQVRTRLSRFNHAFFHEHLERAMSSRLPPTAGAEEARELEAQYHGVVAELKGRQLKLSRGLLRDGVDIRVIASQLPNLSHGAPRTYTGSAPCW